MANIILKGRDASGNIVESTYTGVTSVEFETPNGSSVLFHEGDITANSFNSYVCVAVGEDDPDYSADMVMLRVVAKSTSINTAIAKAAQISEWDLNQYGVPDSNGNLFYWAVLTLKTYTIGEAYSLNEMFGIN